MESIKDKIPTVKIDPEGTYKYVQILYNDKIYLRGRGDCKYHKGIYKKFKTELKKIHKIRLYSFMDILMLMGDMKINMKNLLKCSKKFFLIIRLLALMKATKIR